MRYYIVELAGQGTVYVQANNPVEALRKGMEELDETIQWDPSFPYPSFVLVQESV